MHQLPWLERSFPSDLPPELIPGLLERLLGTSHRVRALTRDLSPTSLTTAAPDGWSLQRHVGHLLDLEPLWTTRVTELLEGAGELTPADMSNQKTQVAPHDEASLADIIDALEQSRTELCARICAAPDAALRQQARHPRLGTSMRLADLLFFVAEHDDHHLVDLRRIATAP